MSGRVGIVGASVRAAAFSALRAGWEPVGIDLFADWDLDRRATAIRVTEYPDGLAAALVKQDIDGWLYTGGIENFPDLVDRLATRRTLWGNSGATLRSVRDPFLCEKALSDSGVRCPPLAASADGLPTNGSWLVKPCKGSGGHAVRAWQGDMAATDLPTVFFQQRMPGIPCSAVFIAAKSRSVLLGATWQLVGTDWTGAGDFFYAGSIGPWEPQPDLDRQWQRIADAIVPRFGLVGLFGVDAVLDGRMLWPIEVNPRYPASVEVLERAMGMHAIGMHIDACRLGHLPECVPRTRACWCGKAILYAPADVVVPQAFGAFAQQQTESWPWSDLADVPRPGTRIRLGKPVTTVLAEEADEATVRELLKRRVERVKQVLYG